MVTSAPMIKLNKSTAHIQLRTDSEIDITAIRIGKQRMARRKETKLSHLKQAIVEHRQVVAPAVTVSEANVPQPLDHDPASAAGSPPTALPQYICHALSADLDEAAFGILKELSRLQAKGKDQPEEKRYKYKKFIVGLREVQRASSRKELKGVIVATNLEAVDELDSLIVQLRDDCAQSEVPFVVALTRRRIGKALAKSMKQSLVGIVSLDGVHQPWKAFVEMAESLKAQYRNDNSAVHS